MSKVTDLMDELDEAFYDAFSALKSEIANGKGVEIVKANPGNGRFKDTSVWIKLPSGNYKHLQSGKVAKASRLAGFVTVVHAE